MPTNQTDMTLTPIRERAVVRRGTVVQTGSDGRVLVDIGGVSVRAGHVTSYAPTPGEQVALALQDASWLVLGAVSGTADPVGLPIPTRRIQSGTALITFVAQSSATLVVTFPVPFVTLPQVVTNIASGAGETARWGSRAIAVGLDTFTIFVFESDVADPARDWTDIPVNWIATAEELI